MYNSVWYCLFVCLLVRVFTVNNNCDCCFAVYLFAVVIVIVVVVGAAAFSGIQFVSYKLTLSLLESVYTQNYHSTAK